MEKKAQPPAKVPVEMTANGVRLGNLDQAYRFARAVVASGLAPKKDTPEMVMVKLVAGAELGFPPMQALASLTVINGRLGLQGDAILAKARQSGVFEHVTVTNEGEGDDLCGVVRSQRRGESGPVEYRFSVADAKRAGLWEGKSVKFGDPKDSPWVKYPDNMLRWRAVQHWGDLYASDVTMGLAVAEILPDYPARNGGEPPAKPPGEPDPLLAGAEVTEAEVEDVPETLTDLLTESVENGRDE